MTEAEAPRVGIIGAGGIGKTHLRAWAANGIKPTAVADAKGRFDVQCLVLPRAMLGLRSLHAAQPAAGGTRSAAATTLVVAGPMEPGRDRLLGRR